MREYQMTDTEQEEFNLSLDVFELGLLYGLLEKQTSWSDPEERELYEPIMAKIYKIRRSMGGSPAK
jgi:hypothetical protein